MVEKGQGAHPSSFPSARSLILSDILLCLSPQLQTCSPILYVLVTLPSLEPRSMDTLCCYKSLGALMSLVGSIKLLNHLCE